MNYSLLMKSTDLLKQNGSISEISKGTSPMASGKLRKLSSLGVAQSNFLLSLISDWIKGVQLDPRPELL